MVVMLKVVPVEVKVWSVVVVELSVIKLTPVMFPFKVSAAPAQRVRLKLPPVMA